MERYLTTMEAAQVAGVTQSTIYNWIKKGYLGDTDKQYVTRGVGCGYKIRESDLEHYIHGWPTEAPEKERIVEVTPVPSIDRQSLQTACNNLSIAIQFAQEELAKIQALL